MRDQRHQPGAPPPLFDQVCDGPNRAPHRFVCGTNSENLAPLPAGTECGVLDSFGNRCGVCGSSGECIRTSPDLETCGDL